jgi:hypothetical protein
MIQWLRFEPFVRRLRHSTREVIVAAALTLAALAFAVAAIHGSAPETAAVIDPEVKDTSRPN